jgi:hypothetical protein
MNHEVYDLEYNYRQGVFHWAFKDDGVKPQWTKIAKSVPLSLLIEFHQHLEKQYKEALKNNGKFMFSILEAKEVFNNYKKRNCPKERTTLINLVGYNSFTENIKNFS